MTDLILIMGEREVAHRFPTERRARQALSVVRSQLRGRSKTLLILGETEADEGFTISSSGVTGARVPFIETPTPIDTKALAAGDRSDP